MKNRRTTLKDIAEKTGYSIPTVSRVLSNGDKYYSDATAKIILEAAAKMNYMPNMIARGLKSGKTYSVVLLVPQMDDFYDSIFSGIQGYLGEKGYSVATLSSDYSEEMEETNISHIRNRNYDGVIVATGFLNQQYNRNPRTVFGDTPLVMLERTDHGDGIPTVSLKVREACCEVVDYLVSQGHRRIAFLSAPPRFDTIEERYLGYQDGLRKNRIPLDKKLIVFDKVLERTDYAAFYNFMKQILSKREYSAIISLSDFAAFASLKVAQQMNIRIPEDLSIVGFDDLVYTEFTVPSLSTVSQNAFQVGRLGGELLLKKLQDEPAESVEVDCRLLIRESVGPCNEA